jgi:hypothetical protein
MAESTRADPLPELSAEEAAAAAALKAAGFSDLAVAYIFNYRKFIENWARANAGLL